MDLTLNPRLDRVRDLFVIGCYTGLRFSDFSQLKKENIINGNFVITPQKTNDKVIVPIHSIVYTILDKYSYSLPEAISKQNFNLYIKEIAKLAGLCESVIINKISVNKCDNLSAHTARRSFATNLFLKGFPAINIMQITGHKTETAFMKYIKVTKEQTADLLKNFWATA